MRVKVPRELPQWLRLRAGVEPPERVFVGLDQVIPANADRLFPGMVILAPACSGSVAMPRSSSTRTTTASKRALVEEEIFASAASSRSCGSRSSRMPIRAMVAELMQRFALASEDVYEMSALLDYTTLFEIAGLEIERACAIRLDASAAGRRSRRSTRDIFSAIRAGDILLHHPYDSFNASVERFIREAADDPQTVSIKMTVYRVGDDTPFVQSLIRAAEAGKQVACVIELNARFDEERNLHWSRELEEVGAHVMFGVTGLKTHSKAALVVRKEDDGMRSYAHIATGNYHTRTARLYEDVGLLTADPAITSDVVTLFHFLTGRSRTPSFGTLLVAPLQHAQRGSSS